MNTIKMTTINIARAVVGLSVFVAGANAKAAHNERAFCPSAKDGQVTISVAFKPDVPEVNVDFFYDNRMERVHYINSQPHISNSRTFTGAAGECVTVAVQHKYEVTGHDPWYGALLWMVNASKILAKSTHGVEVAELTVSK